eukprot:9077647-Pyramimonas_sp.AAC.1
MTIEEKEFVRIDQQNREFARFRFFVVVLFVVVRVARSSCCMYAYRCASYRFLGYDMHSGNPVQGAEWRFQLTALRDAA